MISRRSLFGFALVPLAEPKASQMARAAAYGEAHALRTNAQMMVDLHWRECYRFSRGDIVTEIDFMNE